MPGADVCGCASEGETCRPQLLCLLACFAGIRACAKTGTASPCCGLSLPQFGRLLRSSRKHALSETSGGRPRRPLSCQALSAELLRPPVIATAFVRSALAVMARLGCT
jgi:hypothetical protein